METIGIITIIVLACFAAAVVIVAIYNIIETANAYKADLKDGEELEQVKKELGNYKELYSNQCNITDIEVEKNRQHNGITSDLLDVKNKEVEYYKELYEKEVRHANLENNSRFLAVCQLDKVKKELQEYKDKYDKKKSYKFYLYIPKLSDDPIYESIEYANYVFMLEMSEKVSDFYKVSYNSNVEIKYETLVK